jgi:hypothetical protein
LTTELEAWSVVHEIVAPVVVIPLTTTLEMTGGTAVVVKLELPEVVD